MFKFSVDRETDKQINRQGKNYFPTYGYGDIKIEIATMKLIHIFGIFMLKVSNLVKNSFFVKFLPIEEKVYQNFKSIHFNSWHTSME